MREVSYPESARLCAIDIGSNAIKMRIVDAGGDGSRRTITEERYGIRLGEAFGSGTIPEETMESATGAFEEIAALCRGFAVDRIRAVATSATREAANSRDFLAGIEKKSGIKVDVISGKEEARLLASGVRPDLVRGRHNLVLDVGGGSTELVFLRPNLAVITVRSLRLGAVRLMLQEKCGNKVSRRDFNNLKQYIDEVLEDASLPVAYRDVFAVGVAGTMRALVQACSQDETATVLKYEQLNELLLSLVGLTPDEMEMQYSIDRKRAQVIIPGGLIIQQIMELYELAELTLSARGLRDGVLDELIEEVLGIETVHHAPTHIVRIGEKYDFDSEHGLHVEMLSLKLFDQLKELHGLDGNWRHALRAAAILHDIGKFISYSKHHKHSQFLIQNEEIAGLTPTQQLLASVIARFHRKASPGDTHSEFASLSPEAREGILKCASFLRIADVLDRQSRQYIDIRSARADEKYVTLNLIARGPIELEKNAMPKKAELFEKVFSRKLALNIPKQ